MATKKYPVGMKVRYIGSCESCKNTTGKIIYASEHHCRVKLPKSPHCRSVGWVSVRWSEIEPFVKKNEQLLFSFME